MKLLNENEAAALFRSPDLHDKLKIRLVELAFSSSATTSLRAIELLLGMARAPGVDMFADVGLDRLEELEDAITTALAQFGIEK